MKTINSIHSNLNQQPRKKKPFINKKNSVTFHVVHRSQRDPLAADDSANQHVLLEAPKPSNDKVYSTVHRFQIQILKAIINCSKKRNSENMVSISKMTTITGNT